MSLLLNVRLCTYVYIHWPPTHWPPATWPYTLTPYSMTPHTPTPCTQHRQGAATWQEATRAMCRQLWMWCGLWLSCGRGSRWPILFCDLCPAGKVSGHTGKWLKGSCPIGFPYKSASWISLFFVLLSFFPPSKKGSNTHALLGGLHNSALMMHFVALFGPFKKNWKLPRGSCTWGSHINQLSCCICFLFFSPLFCRLGNC